MLILSEPTRKIGFFSCHHITDKKTETSVNNIRDTLARKG